MLRIALNESSRKILGEWKSDLEKLFPGISVSYPELVGWVVEKIGPGLSKKDQMLIRDRFFDEVKQLEWLAETLREAKSRGEALSLAQLMGKGTKAGPVRSKPKEITEQEEAPK